MQVLALGGRARRQGTSPGRYDRPRPLMTPPRATDLSAVAGPAPGFSGDQVAAATAIDVAIPLRDHFVGDAHGRSELIEIVAELCQRGDGDAGEPELGAICWSQGDANNATWGCRAWLSGRLDGVASHVCYLTVSVVVVAVASGRNEERRWPMA